jgi:hypothetical protein
MTSIPKYFAEECEKVLFPPFQSQEETQAFVLYPKDPKARLQTVEVESYRDLLTQLINAIDPKDLEFYETYSESQSRKFLKDVALNADQGDFPLIPVQLTPSSYVLLKTLNKVSLTEPSEKITELTKRLTTKFKLTKQAQKRLATYIKARPSQDQVHLLEDLLTKKKSQITQLFEEEGLEELEEELLTAPSWTEAYEKFVEVWTQEEDPEERKKIYRELGYVKNPKKTPKQNKEVLASKFKQKYEGLELKERREFVEYLDSDEADLTKAKKMLLGKPKK